MYAQGQGAPQDDVQARRWFREAAAQGVAAAQSVLASMYAQGRGGPQDHEQARHWYEKAAAQGDTPAQLSLGVMYALGEGAPQDLRQAKEWFDIARAKNLENNCSRCCLLGRTVSRLLERLGRTPHSQ